MARSFAIIVAGGTGSRMGTETPKQFLPLAGLPVMMHSIIAFTHCANPPQIIVVIHPDLRGEWLSLCQAHDFNIPHMLVDGGSTRFESVKNGLTAIKSAAPHVDSAQYTIAVHDAARPLVSPELIDETYRQAAFTGAAALAIPATDSIRIVSGNRAKNNSHPRTHVYRMQTPQTFRASILYDAYQQADDGTFSDDASVVEKKGYPVTLVDGDTRNIKVTFAQDLAIAEILLQKHR